MKIHSIRYIPNIYIGFYNEDGEILLTITKSQIPSQFLFSKICGDIIKVDVDLNDYIGEYVCDIIHDDYEHFVILVFEMERLMIEF